MSRLLRHPKCKDFPPFSQNSKKPRTITFEYVTITAKYDSIISPTVKKVNPNVGQSKAIRVTQVHGSLTGKGIL